MTDPKFAIRADNNSAAANGTATSVTATELMRDYDCQVIRFAFVEAVEVCPAKPGRHAFLKSARQPPESAKAIRS